MVSGVGGPPLLFVFLPSSFPSFKEKNSFFFFLFFFPFPPSLSLLKGREGGEGGKEKRDLKEVFFFGGESEGKRQRVEGGHFSAPIGAIPLTTKKKFFFSKFLHHEKKSFFF